MNPRVLEIKGSLIREVAAKRRPTSIDLGLGEPSLMPNQQHFTRAMAYVAEHGIKYSQNAGDPALRERIASHYDYPGMNRIENVCVTTGSQEAMYVTLKTLLNPATDDVLVVEPAFPSYAKMARLEGVGVQTVEMSDSDDFGIDAERIVAALTARTRAIVICSPNNPTGRVISRDEAIKLARALEGRSGDPVWLIHDEIYREQTFVENEAYLAQLYPHTIVTNSVSKSNALTGLRLGWMIAPEKLIEQAIKAHAWVTSCADTFAQQIALDIFRTPGCITEHTSWYRTQRAGVLGALEQSGLRFLKSEGSFYACVRLRDGMKSLDGALALLAEHDVLTIPGSAFGASFEGWLRLSWVAPIDIVREGIARIAKFVTQGASG